jgi:hypothetical protein
MKKSLLKNSDALTVYLVPGTVFYKDPNTRRLDYLVGITIIEIDRVF